MEMNSQYIYLKERNGQKNVDEGDGYNETLDAVLEINQDACQRIGESVGVHKNLDALKWHFNIYDLVRNHARIYTAITLVNTNFFVAFNNVVAIYDVVKKQWTNFFYFTTQVFALLRNQISEKAHELNVGALLESGEVKIIDRPKVRGDEWHEDVTAKIKVEGKILKVVSDWRDISSHYILSLLPSGKKSLSGFQRNIITVLDQSVEL